MSRKIYDNDNFMTLEKAKNNENTLSNIDDNYIILLKHVNAIESTVLEIGCGSGIDCFILGEKFKYWEGIDLNESAIKYGDSIINHQNTKLTVMDGNNIDVSKLKYKKYDILLFTLSLHFLDYKKCITNCINLLNDNGIVFIIEPIEKIHFTSPELIKSNINFNEKKYEKKKKDISECKKFISNESNHIFSFFEEQKNKYILKIKS